MVEERKGENLTNQKYKDNKNEEEKKMNKKVFEQNEIEEKLLQNESDIEENLNINIDILDEKKEEDNSNLSNEDEEIVVPIAQMVQAEKRETEYKTVAIYPYVNEEGKTVFEILKRTGPGEPYLTRYQEEGEYIYSMPKNIQIPIYNLQEVRKGIKEKKPIWILEGESKVEAMKKLGFVATTVPYKGPNKWNRQYNKFLIGAQQIIIFYDNDERSREFKEYTSSKICKEPNFKKVFQVGVEDFYKNIKEGGDIEDLIEKVGEERVRLTLEAFEESL